MLEAVTPAVTANSVLFEPHKTSVSNGVSTESVVLALVRKEAVRKPVRTESAVSAALVSGEVSAPRGQSGINPTLLNHLASGSMKR